MISAGGRAVSADFSVKTAFAPAIIGGIMREIRAGFWRQENGFRLILGKNPVAFTEKRLRLLR